MNVALWHDARAAHATLGDLVADRFAAALARFSDTSDSSREAAGANLDAATARLESHAEGATRQRLNALFRLDPAERDLLDAALALRARPTLARELATVPPGIAGLTEAAVVTLFGHANRPILRPTSALVRWSLVEPGAGGIVADPDIAALLGGRPGFDRVLARCAAVVAPPAFALPGWPVEETAAAAMRLTEMGRSVRVMITALPGSGRQLFAAAVAASLSSRVIRVTRDPAGPEDSLYMHAQRLALLTGHALVWAGGMPPRPPELPSAPLQFVTVDPHSPQPPAEGLVDLWIDLPPLRPDDRDVVWTAAGGDRGGVSLAGCGRIATGARLSDLLALAEHEPADDGAARAILARRIRDRLEGTGHVLPLPYRRDDLVLAPAVGAQLDTLLADLAAHERLLADDTLAQHYGRLGQSILFHGPSGTGKTMGAQVLAQELGANLVRIDCAAIVSKYIGETVKQLRELFDRLRGSGAIAFFDEADSLFARRTELKDANDRHANADTNYLLQLIEDFDGISILATNRKDNIDPAFLRRLRYVVEFGELGPAARSALWERHVQALTGGKIAHREASAWSARLALAELTPAQIKGAALTGRFVGDGRGADPTQLEDFVRGIERELAKDGRALDPGLKRRMSDD